MHLANLEVSIEYNVVEDRVLDWFLGNCCEWPNFPYYLGGGSNSNDKNREGSPAVRLLPSTGGTSRSEALLNGDSVVAKDDGACGDRCFDALNTSPTIADEESLGVETVWIPDEEEEEEDDDYDDDVDCFNEVRDDHPDASTSPPPYSASPFPLYPASTASLSAKKQPSSTRLAAAKTAADSETLSSSSASSRSNRRRPRQPKSVHFCPTVQVCTYEIVLSHHPCCRDGMAIECGWAHGGVKRVDLEVLERQCRHRPERELYLDFFARRQRLLRVTGLSDFDLDAAAIGMMDCWSH